MKPTPLKPDPKDTTEAFNHALVAYCRKGKVSDTGALIKFKHWLAEHYILVKKGKVPF